MSDSHSDYFDLLNETVVLAAGLGYLMMNVGAEPENIFDRQHQLITKSGHKLVMTGTVRVLNAWLKDAERGG